MFLFVFIAATLAAILNAASTVLQRRAAGSPKKDELFSKKFANEVTRHPLFIVGLVFQILAAALHLLALSKGSLLIVQPLLTLNLIFLFGFYHFRYKLKTGHKEWRAIIAIIIGLCALFLVADPRSGTKPYNLDNWLVAVAAIVFIIFVTIGITKRTHVSSTRAAAAGMSAAAGFALNASLAKLTLGMLKAHNLGYVFLHWPVYALLLSAVISIFLMQNAYGSGSIAISQPIMEIFDPIMSSIIGLVNFGDIIRHSPEAIIGELLSAALLAWGVYTLGGSKKLHIKFD